MIFRALANGNTCSWMKCTGLTLVLGPEEKHGPAPRRWLRRTFGSSQTLLQESVRAMSEHKMDDPSISALGVLGKKSRCLDTADSTP